ncbi:MAG: hypothetical protein Q4C10_10440 [Clostridia bacterium]|nr:hypothetical protein [Clostridia bacterium]
MKKMALILIFCLVLSPVCLAEVSSAQRFLSNLSSTWDSFLDMAEDAGESVSQWADESGVTGWVEGAVNDVTAWADGSGLTSWAQGALNDISAWAGDIGFTEWAQRVSAEAQALIEENRPAVEAWLAQAGEDVQQAWNTLVNAEDHSEEEVQQALETVMESSAGEIDAGFAYEHDPRENPEAMKDIVVNPDAVYGFSPSPDSTRLKEFVDALDWTDPDQVAAARAQRQAYHDSISELYRMIEDMLTRGDDVETIARAVSQRRNELRLESYADDPDGLAATKKSNLETYGDEMGPTADSLYEKYGSWQTVLEKALGTNVGMDACLGFYDEYYDYYDIG